MSVIQWNIDLVREYVEKYGSGDSLISKRYVGYSSKLVFYCSRCQKEYSTRWGGFITGARCKACSMKILWDKSRKSKKDVIAEIRDCGYEVLEDFEYHNNETKIHIEDKNGYKYFLGYTGIVTSFKKEYNLKRFNEANPHTIDNINLWLLKNNRPCFVVDGTYVAFSKKTIFFECSKCGHRYISSLGNIWNTRNSGCPICSSREMNSSNMFSVECPELLNDWDYDKNIYKPEEISKGSHKKIWWICHNGHYSYLASVPNRRMGKGCPLCGKEMIESKVAQYLKEYCHGIFGEECFPEYRLIRNPKTGYYLKNDIYIAPLLLHIEVMGSQHYQKTSLFHKSEDAFAYQQYKDDIKRKEVIRLNHKYLEIDLRSIKSKEESKLFLDQYFDSIMHPVREEVAIGTT